MLPIIYNMKEKYLHYLWQNKLLPFHKMTLTDASSFKVIYPGDYNASDSGPDFLNAQLELNGIRWFGNVELHVKGSDWYLHKHQNDRAYDNVILHVVYEDNKPVFINKIPIPTLELRSFINLEHYASFERLARAKKTILCSNSLQNVPAIYIENMKERSLVNRLYRKTQDLSVHVHSEEPKDILYFLLARAMGAKTNQLPFEQLTQKLPLSIVKQISKNKQSVALCLASGLFSAINPTEFFLEKELLRKLQFENYLVRHSWKNGGVRPRNRPTERVLQFSRIVEQFDFDTSFVYFDSDRIYAHLQDLLTITNEKSNSLFDTPRLSTSFKNHLIINAFIPFFFWVGKQRADENLIEKAIELLISLPPESNSIINKWKKTEVLINNAGDSQALLEIFNEFCTKKKCLTCSIGNQLLKQ